MKERNTISSRSALYNLTSNLAKKEPVFAIRIFELKDYLGLANTTDVIRFALTFTYRKLVEVDKKFTKG